MYAYTTMTSGYTHPNESNTLFVNNTIKVIHTFQKKEYRKGCQLLATLLVWSNYTRIWSKYTRIWSNYTRIWSNYTRIWSNYTRIWSNYTRIWSKYTRIYTCMHTYTAASISLCAHEPATRYSAVVVKTHGAV
jgi:hypothetical protein